jgi:hypothetical protein
MGEFNFSRSRFCQYEGFGLQWPHPLSPSLWLYSDMERENGSRSFLENMLADLPSLRDEGAWRRAGDEATLDINSSFSRES